MLQSVWLDTSWIKMLKKETKSFLLFKLKVYARQYTML